MELYVNETGSADHPAIVFLHGGGGGGWMWQPQMEGLSDAFHCLAPDLPEHGHSMEVKPFTIRGSAGMIADLIRQRVPGGKAHVVGLSEGAQITVALLSLAPEVVDHAIISSAILRPIPFSRMLTPGMVGLMYDVSVPPFKNNDWWIRINMKYAAGIPESYFPIHKKAFQEYTRESFVHLMVENQAFRLPAGLERATAPVLVVVGSKEYAAMIQSGRDLLAALPNATGRMVSLGKGASMAQEHNWSMNAPELFTRMVRAWVSGEALPEELLPL
ncbi:MAG: alpha/beta hydrolase [Chloroflexi bacterium]|nr:alpha/beta hydrolase [Chloroflexota bacterium]